MSLSAELISQFAKVTNDKTVTKKESTVYGTIVTKEGVDYVHIDGAFTKEGSVILVPLTSTVTVQNGDRVIVSIRNHMAVVTGNLTAPSTNVEHVKIVETTVSNKIETNDLVVKERLEAAEARIEDLEVYDAEVKGTISAQNAQIYGKLDAATAEITYAKIEQLNSHYAEFDTVRSDYAAFKETYTEDLIATDADIANLDAGVATINKLLFGSAAGTVLHTSFANAVIALLGDAWIKSAMVESLSADKINAGNINTNNVKVQSKDGSLVIFDNLIQIKDGQNVRVQIGKDASGNYSIAICDKNGATMFDVNGITENAIKEAIIVDAMVSEGANISGSKINIDSLISAINTNGSSTIKSTKVYFDDEEQTLDIMFKELSTDVSEVGETVVSQGTEITAINEWIESKVWEQDIDTPTGEMNTKYTELRQDVDSITTTVASHTSDIAETQSVADDTHTRLTVTESLVQQLADSISMLVTDENGTSLMTQTEDGWTFSTAEIQDMINSTSEDLHNLTEEVGETNAAVDILKQGFEDLGVISEYVKIGTYEDEPCIELGEGDSDFKLLVTNTRILFMDGSDVPAYITNKSLYIKKAVIEEELHQGNWVWKARSNGNLGLQWKGSD